MTDQVFIDTRDGYLRAAVLRDGVLDDLYLLPVADPAPAGAVFIGRVRRILPGLNGAFVDLGTGMDGFLRASAARFAGRSGGGAPFEERPQISDLVTEGQAALAQVVRPGDAGKGPIVTTDLTLPGRYVVLKGREPTLSLSRRIEEESVRDRLSRALSPLLDGEVGFIVRTAAAAVDEAALRTEAEALRHDWEDLQTRAHQAEAPERIWVNGAPLLRILRELEVAPGTKIRVQGVDEFATARRHVDTYWPDLAGALAAESGPDSLFRATGTEEMLDECAEPEVALIGGGALAIERTRALTAIDVDTGGRSGRGGPGSPILETNLAAAAEIARQLRVRNICGVVVVDFVRMRRSQDRAVVVKALREAFAADHTGVQILGMSPLGLVEMSRERNAYASLEAVLEAGGGQ
jgi:ribonuclease G